PHRAFRQLFSRHSLQGRTVDRIYKSLLQLPLIDLEQISLAEVNVDDSDRQPAELTVSKEEIFKPAKDVNWIRVKRNTDYLVRCCFRRLQLPSAGRQGRGGQRAFTPRFPKPKSESWYLVLGVQQESDLVGISRVPVINSRHPTQVALQFRTPSEPIGARSERIF